MRLPPIAIGTMLRRFISRLIMRRLSTQSHLAHYFLPHQLAVGIPSRTEAIVLPAIYLLSMTTPMSCSSLTPRMRSIALNTRPSLRRTSIVRLILPALCTMFMAPRLLFDSVTALAKVYQGPIKGIRCPCRSFAFHYIYSFLAFSTTSPIFASTP